MPLWAARASGLTRCMRCSTMSRRAVRSSEQPAVPQSGVYRRRGHPGVCWRRSRSWARASIGEKSVNSSTTRWSGETSFGRCGTPTRILRRTVRAGGPRRSKPFGGSVVLCSCAIRCFETLRKQFRMPWWEWPQQYRQPDDAVIQEFRSGDLRADMEFVEYLQWNAHTQLQACTDRAAEGGMQVGLYLDVAVGVRPTASMPGSNSKQSRATFRSARRPICSTSQGRIGGLSGFNGSGLSARRLSPFAP